MFKNLIFPLFPFFVLAQKVYSVDYESQSDIKVSVVDYKSQCGLNHYLFNVIYWGDLRFLCV